MHFLEKKMITSNKSCFSSSQLILDFIIVFSLVRLVMSMFIFISLFSISNIIGFYLIQISASKKKKT